MAAFTRSPSPGMWIADKWLLSRTLPPSSTSHLFLTNHKRKWNTFVAHEHLRKEGDKAEPFSQNRGHVVCADCVCVYPHRVCGFISSRYTAWKLCVFFLSCKTYKMRFLIFLFQGDKESELGLPFSPLCDRKSTMVAQSQIGEWMSLLVLRYLHSGCVNMCLLSTFP